MEEWRVSIRIMGGRTMVGSDGFRPNVGIIVSNAAGQVLWARRIGQDAWQFPQGGIRAGEAPEEALFRELHEELGLLPEQVRILGYTRRWLTYRLPPRYIRRHQRPRCIGQRQRWYLLRLLCDDADVCLDRTESPEFDGWRWVDYWYPVNKVIAFKQRVYEQALAELEPLLDPGRGERPPRSATAR